MAFNRTYPEPYFYPGLAEEEICLATVQQPDGTFIVEDAYIKDGKPAFRQIISIPSDSQEQWNGYAEWRQHKIVCGMHTKMVSKNNRIICSECKEDMDGAITLEQRAKWY